MTPSLWSFPISHLSYFHSLITCNFAILATVRTYVIVRIPVTFNHGKSFPQSFIWLSLMVVIFLKFYFWNTLSELMASGYPNSFFLCFSQQNLDQFGLNGWSKLLGIISHEILSGREHKRVLTFWVTWKLIDSYLERYAKDKRQRGSSQKVKTIMIL